MVVVVAIVVVVVVVVIVSYLTSCLFQGTPLYMAPELFEMESLSSSMTSKDYVFCDVFALGVVIHEILCGEHPFEGKDATKPGKLSQQ